MLGIEKETNMRPPSSCGQVEVVDEEGSYSSLKHKALVLGVLLMSKAQVKSKVVPRKEHQKVLQSWMDPSMST
jgi:hypothetical protein